MPPILKVFAESEDEAAVLGDLVRLVLAHEGRDPGVVVAIYARPLSREVRTPVPLPAIEFDGTVLCRGELPSFDLLREWVRTLPEDPDGHGEELRRQRAPWSLYDTPAVAVRLWLEDRHEERESTAKIIRAIEWSLHSAEGLPRRYFPVGKLSSDLRSDSFMAIWLSRALDAMGEPPFSSLRQESCVERYRFLWLRAFHRPVVVRVELGERASLRWKSARGRGECNPGEPVQDRTRVLSAEERDRFTRALGESGFWELQVEKPVTALDGAEWIFEGERGGRRRVIMRWSGQELQPLGREFLALTGETFEPIY
jgi:hypothetical protein